MSRPIAAVAASRASTTGAYYLCLLLLPARRDLPGPSTSARSTGNASNPEKARTYGAAVKLLSGPRGSGHRKARLTALREEFSWDVSEGLTVLITGATGVFWRQDRPNASPRAARSWCSSDIDENHVLAAFA